MYSSFQYISDHFLWSHRLPRVMQQCPHLAIQALPAHLVSSHAICSDLIVISHYIAANNQTIQFRSASTVLLPYGQGIGIPYGYPTAGFVSGLPIDQSFRSTYPFLMAGQYVTQMPYSQQPVCVCVCVCESVCIYLLYFCVATCL